MAKEPFFRAPKVVLVLIAVLVLVHVAIQLAGESWQVWSLYAFSFIPARISGAAPFPAIWGSQVWSFVTYGLLHADMMHLFFNSLWFLIFGSVVARRLGTLKFLVLACVSTIMGAVATLLTHWGEGSDHDRRIGRGFRLDGGGHSADVWRPAFASVTPTAWTSPR